MQVERIVTWDGVIYKAEKTEKKISCIGCCFNLQITMFSSMCFMKDNSLFECLIPNDIIWKRIGTMPKGKK